MRKVIVLFDGVCLFCEGWVNFVISNKSDNLQIKFVPLQFVNLSPAVLTDLNIYGADKDTILFIDKDVILFKSDASLKVMSLMKFPYNVLAKLFLVIPKNFRNYVYDLIGKNRYRIWGKRNFCRVPLVSEKHYFPTNISELADFDIVDISRYFTFKV